MRCIVVLCVLLVTVGGAVADPVDRIGPVFAQPVSYEVQGDVAVGKKPMLRLTAVKRVTAVKIDLARDDGKKFTVTHAALTKGQVVMLAIGDGAAGKATYKGTLAMKVDGEGNWNGELAFDTLVRAPVKVSYDIEHLDLDKHVLQFKLSRPAGSAELVVIGEDGKDLGKGSATYTKEAADTWLSITWTQPANTRVMIMKLRAVSAEGLATNVELIPWSVNIDHEDVRFSVDSAKIEPGESAKLDASLAKIAEVVKRSERFMKMKLFVAGHTDTVGTNTKNTKLSLDRARAIAGYLRKQGITLPIAFAGFGEEVLKVKTPDQTDEALNRRADYVIGPAAGAPPFKGAYLKARVGWQLLK